MSNSNSSKQILLSVIGIAILVVAVVGVSFAFYNYTKTGQLNTVRTGTITFNTSSSVINITNLFPIKKSEVADEQLNVGMGTVTITGSTDYVNGIDFTVTAESVSDSIGTTTGKLPISIAVTATGLDGVKTFGTNNGSITLNSYEDGNTITSGSILARGRIPANANINGTITIKAYIDQSQVVITDTYPPVTHYSLDTNKASECVSHELMATGFTGTETAEAFCAGTGTRNGKTFQQHLDEGLFTSAQIESLLTANIIKVAYTDGTSAEWVDGRTVLTTAEWNALATTPASFTIKVVGNNGSS